MAECANCGDCSHWKTIQVTLYGPNWQIWTGHKFEPSDDANSGEAAPIRGYESEYGVCEKLNVGGYGPEHNEVAAAVGYDSDHNFYCKAEFGCVLFEKATQRWDHIAELELDGL